MNTKLSEIAESAKIPFAVSFVFASLNTILYFIITDGWRSSLGELGSIMAIVEFLLFLLFIGLSFYGGWLAVKKFNATGIWPGLSGAAGPIATAIISMVFHFFYAIYVLGNIGIGGLLSPWFTVDFFGFNIMYYPWGATIVLLQDFVIYFLSGSIGAYFAIRNK